MAVEGSVDDGGRGVRGGGGDMEVAGGWRGEGEGREGGGPGENRHTRGPPARTGARARGLEPVRAPFRSRLVREGAGWGG